LLSDVRYRPSTLLSPHDRVWKNATSVPASNDLIGVLRRLRSRIVADTNTLRQADGFSWSQRRKAPMSVSPIRSRQANFELT
jgi:hypothetical protein